MRKLSQWIALSCCSMGACLPTPSRDVDERRVVAMVDSMPVYIDDFERELDRIKIKTSDGAPSAAALQTQKHVLLDSLIDRRLVLREAEQKNVLVGTDEIELAFKSNRHGWVENEFKQMMESQDLTPSELKQELRELLLVRKYFRDHVYSRVAVTDAEVDAYIESHPELQIVPEQVRARQIVVKTEDEATEVLQEIRRGTAFQEAAMKYSLTPEGKSGGDLGFFPRGVIPAALEEAAFSQKVGQVSAVIATEYGFHILEVTDRRPELARNGEEIRSEVEAQLRRQKELQAQRNKIAELRNNAKIVIQEARLAQIR